MTIPACCSTPGKACPVGCFDDVHVRDLARRFVKVCFTYLRGGCSPWHGWDALNDLAYEWQKATTDARCERDWPALTVGGHPCGFGGWVVNASEDDILALIRAIQGPMDERVVRRRGADGIERVTALQEPTFRLPVMKPRERPQSSPRDDFSQLAH